MPTISNTPLIFSNKVAHKGLMPTIKIIGAVLGFLCLTHTNLSQANDMFALEKIGCPIMPTKNITITDKTVSLSQNSDTWLISRDGSMTLNGKFVNLSENEQNKAEQFQQTVRDDLPNLLSTTHTLIDTNLEKLDTTIVDTLGKNSQLREKIKELKPIIFEELNQVINDKNNEVNLSIANLSAINENIESLSKKHGQEILKIALSEIAMKQLLAPKDQRINLSDLQNTLKERFASEDKKARALLETSCDMFANWQTLESGFIKQ
ncbi:DUF2884 family protein [Thorsellia anophelis]|uniref:DUF2884 family protein n=1 Tax=Thorsellia anophelis DSM 18579 TaxID=1123402 RepID=A0A1H9Y347_9GAMM|nr:DUF2884 family protein [Thorsellia anophelis]SES63073.1 Protein of unknown function [Thorsellia anophelis DSM 18579]